jgi:hypothetical protein
MGAEEWLAPTSMTRGASHRNARRDAGRGWPLPAWPILSGAPASVRRAGLRHIAAAPACPSAPWRARAPSVAAVPHDRRQLVGKDRGEQRTFSIRWWVARKSARGRGRSLYAGDID